MAQKSAIEWTESTWNPVTGCTKVSPGCQHCYAERLSERFRGVPSHPYEMGFDLTLRPERLVQPLKWKRPRRVFVNSMSDLFHEDVPDEFIDRVFAVMSISRGHTFQVLTKRAVRMQRYLVSRSKSVEYWEKPARELGHTLKFKMDGATIGLLPFPPPNVWLGVSVEDEVRARERIPLLLDTPAALRFVSVEPLLGPIELNRVKFPPCPKDEPLQPINRYPDQIDFLSGKWVDTTGIGYTGPKVDWVIVGGESGPRARPMKSEWVKSIRDQCQSSGVPFFFKQWGGRTPKAGGNVLDGRQWLEYPECGIVSDK